MRTVNVVPLRYPWSFDYAGMMLVHNGETAVLVDTALNDAADTVIGPALRLAGLDWSALAWTAVTHTHFDHAGCIAAVRNRSHALVAVHKTGAEELIRHGTTPDLLLDDGAEFGPDGLQLTAVHTPGHSADSASFLEPFTGTLFTGDAVQGRGTAGGGLALFNDPDACCRSMRKLLDLHRAGAFDKMLFGHPFLPSEGEVSGVDIEPFLQGSVDTVLSYRKVIGDALKRNPELSAEEARRILLARCGTSLVPGAADLSLGMARTMLSCVRKEAEHDL